MEAHIIIKSLDDLVPQMVQGAKSIHSGLQILAYIIVASGVAITAAQKMGDYTAILKKIIVAAIVVFITANLYEWMGLIGGAFSDLAYNTLGADPTESAQKFLTLLESSSEGKKPGFFGKMFHPMATVQEGLMFSIIWIFGWVAYAVQLLIQFIARILLILSWAFSPPMLALIMLDSQKGKAYSYIMSMIALAALPVGFAAVALVTNGLMEATTGAMATDAGKVASSGVVSLTIIIGLWLILGPIISTMAIYKMVTSGGNMATAMMGGAATTAVGVGTAAISGGTSALAGGASEAAALGSSAMSGLSAGIGSAISGSPYSPTGAALASAAYHLGGSNSPAAPADPVQRAAEIVDRVKRGEA